MSLKEMKEINRRLVERLPENRPRDNKDETKKEDLMKRSVSKANYGQVK